MARLHVAFAASRVKILKTKLKLKNTLRMSCVVPTQRFSITQRSRVYVAIIVCQILSRNP